MTNKCADPSRKFHRGARNSTFGAWPVPQHDRDMLINGTKAEKGCINHGMTDHMCSLLAPPQKTHDRIEPYLRCIAAVLARMQRGAEIGNLSDSFDRQRLKAWDLNGLLA
jgi:hypothetical protein